MIKLYCIMLKELSKELYFLNFVNPFFWVSLPFVSLFLLLKYIRSKRNLKKYYK